MVLHQSLSRRNNCYPIKLLWDASPESVKYKVYTWFREIAEVTGTEFTSKGYNRFHLKAVDAAGRLSAAKGYVFSFRLHDRDRGCFLHYQNAFHNKKAPNNPLRIKIRKALLRAVSRAACS
ncbi:hypothetical protein ALQ53_02166 [Pseudomonas cannabina]|uniref:Uncharacterized protein n=1 Tax=Pseudomonas cannabina TaxID=86840 RepID=A0AB37Q1R2_PSECA|nr:hypothetical protein ALQ53_02166 [Pseudomonas cannabina]